MILPFNPPSLYIFWVVLACKGCLTISCKQDWSVKWLLTGWGTVKHDSCLILHESWSKAAVWQYLRTKTQQLLDSCYTTLENRVWSMQVECKLCPVEVCNYKCRSVEFQVGGKQLRCPMVIRCGGRSLADLAQMLVSFFRWQRGRGESCFSQL